MTTASIDSLKTPGDIARTLGVRLHRVTYCLNTRPIRPIRRAGVVRLYAPEAVQAVRDVLDQIDSRHTPRRDVDGHQLVLDRARMKNPACSSLGGRTGRTTQRTST